CEPRQVASAIPQKRAIPCSCLEPSNQSGICTLNRSRSTTLPAVSRAISSRKNAATFSVVASSRRIRERSVQGVARLQLVLQGLECRLAVMACLARFGDPARVERFGRIAPGLLLLGRE